MELKEREQVVKDLQEIVDNYSGSWKRFNVLDGTLALIKELTEENEKLKDEIRIQHEIINERADDVIRHDNFIRDLHKQLESCKAETVQKIQERLKYSLCCIPQCHFTYAGVEFHIDRIAKERLED